MIYDEFIIFCIMTLYQLFDVNCELIVPYLRHYYSMLLITLIISIYRRSINIFFMWTSKVKNLKKIAQQNLSNQSNFKYPNHYNVNGIVYINLYLLLSITYFNLREDRSLKTNFRHLERIWLVQRCNSIDADR